MSAIAVLAQVFALVVLAPVVPGVVTRTKSWWSGRRGPPVLQLAYDLARLARKTPVYSATTTPVFRTAPYVVLGATVVASFVVPLAAAPLVTFAGDFVFFAYAWGLARVATMLGALDTGSPFEGMGASREATFSALLEPALFLLVGAIGLACGASTLAEVLQYRGANPTGWIVWLLAIVTLIIVVQVESSRMPVDDPTTHLELTMIHEVMILDHSGPDLAALEYAAALKLTTGLAMIAALLLPLGAGLPPWGLWLGNVVGCLLLAVALGTAESLIARLRMRAVPGYILVALTASAAAVLASAWNVPGGQP